MRDRSLVASGLAALFLLSASVRPAAAAHGADETPEQAQPSGHSTAQKVTEAIFPKSWQIPGTEVFLSVGGYAKLDVIVDFDEIGNTSEFQTNSIPVGEGVDGDVRTNLHGRETRFSLGAHSKTPHGNFQAFFEGDFYGDKNAFRLRHGYGELGGFLAGQTWTTWQDLSARPLTLDFEGPDGEVFVRQALVRWTQSAGKNWKWAIAIENPSSQFAVPEDSDGELRSSLPDLPAMVRYQATGGHVQVGGILRQLRLDQPGEEESLTATGYGVNGSFSLKTVGKSALSGQLVIGTGIARYIESLGGQNADAMVTADGDLESLDSWAGLIGYTHFWTDTLRSGMGYSFAVLDETEGLAGTMIHRTQDVRASLVWSPYKLVDVGGEILWGERENQDGTAGDALRLQFSSIFRFN